jgi:DNA (cytosine-5)-methyltransferase 1
MKFGSLFSGIGGFDLAFERAGMECSWQCEIDRSCQKLLKERFGKPVYDDVRTITRDSAEPVELICGGFPCQDLSIAGKRKGFTGERSGLWFEFARIIGEFRPEWVVIENVPGLLSSNRGADFAVLLRGLVEFGYGVSWRILDAQNFGVAQRRRRVFIVGSLGNGRSAEVLFEREGLFRDTPKGRKTGEGTAESFTIRSGKEGGGKESLSSTEIGMTLGGQPQYMAFDINRVDDGRKDRPEGGLYVHETNKSLTLSTGNAKGQTVIAYENHPNDSRITETGEISQQLTSRMGTGGGNVPLVQCLSSGQANAEITDDISPALTLLHEQPIVNGVRRLTPTECERLQGFPDGWTDGQSDTVRYKQLGNAVAVPVAEWIGKMVFNEK